MLEYDHRDISFVPHPYIHSPLTHPTPPLQITGKVAAPLARTNEIVILSGDGSRVTSEVTRLLAELPVTVNALTGVDLSKVSLAEARQGRKGFQGRAASVC